MWQNEQWILKSIFDHYMLKLSNYMENLCVNSNSLTINIEFNHMIEYSSEHDVKYASPI